MTIACTGASSDARLVLRSENGQALVGDVFTCPLEKALLPVNPGETLFLGLFAPEDDAVFQYRVTFFFDLK